MAEESVRFKVQDDVSRSNGTIGTIAELYQQETWRHMTQDDGMAKSDRVFLDIGSSTGNAVFSAFNSGLFEKCYGLEVDTTATNWALATLDEAALKNPLVKEHIKFGVGSIFQFPNLGEVTHGYCFSVGMPPHLILYIVALALNSGKLRSFTFFLDKRSEARDDVEGLLESTAASWAVKHTFSPKMRSGYSYRAIVLRRVAETQEPLDIDWEFEPKRVDVAKFLDSHPPTGEEPNAVMQLRAQGHEVTFAGKVVMLNKFNTRPVILVASGFGIPNNPGMTKNLLFTTVKMLQDRFKHAQGDEKQEILDFWDVYHAFLSKTSDRGAFTLDDQIKIELALVKLKREEFGSCDAE